MKKNRKQRRCCACKKRREIVNVGGPPLCKDCYPLACNWSEALEKHHKFMRSLAGINSLVINIGRKDDDLTYWLECVAEDLAEAKFKIRQAEICLINVCTMLRNEPGKIDKKQKRLLDVIPETKRKNKTIKLNTKWEPMK